MLMKMLTLLFSLYLRLCDYTQTLNYFFFFCTIPSSCVYLDGLWRPYIPNFHNNIFHNEHGEALEQVAQRSCGCLFPVQGQDGWGVEQPGVAEGVPAYGSGVGTR